MEQVKLYDSVLIQENTSQWKLVFLHILCSILICFSFVRWQSKYRSNSLLVIIFFFNWFFCIWKTSSNVCGSVNQQKKMSPYKDTTYEYISLEEEITVITALKYNKRHNYSKIIYSKHRTMVVTISFQKLRQI